MTLEYCKRNIARAMVIDLMFTAQRIKNLRKRLKLNQRDFAERVGVAQPTVSMWETGLRTPEGGEVLARLSHLESKVNGG